MIKPSFLQCALVPFGLHLVVIHYLYFFNFSGAITQELMDDIAVVTSNTNKNTNNTGQCFVEGYQTTHPEEVHLFFH